MKSILSIIVTAHNFEPFISKCLTSIQKCIETYSNDIEIILIDDKSTDNTSNIMMDFSNLVKSSKYLRTEFGNIGKVRNYAIQNCNGQYITFIDGDDTLPTFDINQVIGFLVSNEVDILISRINDVKKDSDYIDKSIFSSSTKLIQHKAIQEFLIHKKFQAHLCSKFFSRKLFNNLKIPEISCYEDALIFPDLLQRSRNIYIINSVFYNYIKRNDSLSSNITNQKVDIMADIILCMNNKFGDKYQNIVATHAIEHLLKNGDILSSEKKSALKALIKNISKFSFFIDPNVRFSFKKKLLKL
ncbi:glycosyltransferase family 2 protein [Photorhabdus antumapuensis]|uniref:glycosyltransferase family 2 protein n=1 Tax=Photorhabdus antumapuensis TaxID=2862867 RepID=UPI001CED91F1|nr:glycosyltransferase family 2 protein [Photorhabdus antumapuensis]MCA6221765.1 glycosyltransferase [Photorhabdus antumapuensis]